MHQAGPIWLSRKVHNVDLMDKASHPELAQDQNKVVGGSLGRMAENKFLEADTNIFE